MTNSQFAREMLAQAEAANKSPYDKRSYTEHVNHMQSKKHENETDFLFEAADNARARQQKRIKFVGALKENLLQECFNVVFDRIMEAERATPHEKAIGRSMISKLIKEEGANTLLTRFEHKNLILSEFARYTEKYYKLAVEASLTDDGDDCYALDKTIAEKFMDDVKDLVPDRTIDIIRDRVGDAMQTFIDQNTESKLAIKDIYLKAKISVDKAADETVKEEYTAMAKGLASRVYDKPVNVFGAMVNAIGESVLRVESLKEQYTEGKKIKMEQLCDDVRVMYTVLEMANTLNAITVNEDYIKQIIVDLKE